MQLKFIHEELKAFITCATLVFLFACLSGCGDGNQGKPVDVVFTQSSVTVNGKEFKGAIKLSELEEALGPSERKFEKANDIYVWDSYGIYAYTRTGKKVLSELAVDFVAGEFDFSPKMTFAGKVSIEGNSFSKRTAQKHFLEGGFKAGASAKQCVLDMGRRKIFVEHDESAKVIQSISFALK
jgi:hypothetical protein